LVHWFIRDDDNTRTNAVETSRHQDITTSLLARTVFRVRIPPSTPGRETRALEEAAKRQTAPERVTIFTDAQAAIRRIVSEARGPGQKYAILARRHIATLRRARPDITIEIRSCPAHKGDPGNEKADEWAKLAAEKLDVRGVERLPRSLSHLKRETSGKKWAEARQRSGGRITRKK
jgi:hypothetical protein